MAAQRRVAADHTADTARGTPARHARLARVERVYREAARLFSLSGFAGVTTRDIAKASGTTMALLYYHFGSKEALYEEIVQLRYEQFLNAVLAEWKRYPKVQRSPAAMVSLVLDAVVADPTFFRMIQHDLHLASTGGGAAAAGRYRGLIAMVGRTLPAARTRATDDTEILALASFITGYCELVLASPEMRGGERAAFVERHRRTAMQLTAKMF